MPTTFGNIQTMALAYQQICEGEGPWIALGNFTNAWYGYAKDIRSTLVSEPLALPATSTDYTHHWAAFCAASVEFLCERYGVPCPFWVHNPYYILSHPWYGDERENISSSAQQELMRTTAAPFAKRNIFCGNRIFQNKYEMSAWVQEARAKGITDPGEIWQYARQKEISIHGG
ncbi:MAG TPA: hypothetical protein VFB60_05540 [Ktedonobacteraceae bacterium]|nr:hypothetical protein [Ktedonobacteraceae bacterium]